MVEERDLLMRETWPQLRQHCRERQVELVEVDLRWGISEEQSTRRETLRLCLDEIRSCRPFFIGLLGERYGWVPGEDALTADLREEQPWLEGLRGRSVTELEILHGVLNAPEMARRSFFYFRDPGYARGRGRDFLPENSVSAGRQTALKARIRQSCAEKAIPLHEDYPDPRRLAALVLEDLEAAIDAQFPLADVPDWIDRQARDHEAFAMTRRRTYIGRPDAIEALDRHADGHGDPLVLMGEPGCGKSALLANWIARRRGERPDDFIVQHYIGSTADSSDHVRLMSRLIAEIKRWTEDSEEPPRSPEEIRRDFPVWLTKARSQAERRGVRCILALDALNQLDDADHASRLAWLPARPFAGALRLLVSTLPGAAQDALRKRGWPSFRLEPLTTEERRRLAAAYLARFGKRLDLTQLDRLAGAPATANPLYLKIVLDELRVTGTHERLDRRLNDYLGAGDIPALLRMVLSRYRHDYEHDRRGLVGDALGLIWAARRGLAEAEILRLLRPSQLPQLPHASWAPLRAAIEEGLVDRSGILNFGHDFFRDAVEATFVNTGRAARKLRARLADDFAARPVTARTSDELPWLLQKLGARGRLRECLLEIDRFVVLHSRDPRELMAYWIDLGESRTMGRSYAARFEDWSREWRHEPQSVATAANHLSSFCYTAALYDEAEPLMRRAVQMEEETQGPDHSGTATALNNMASLLQATGRLTEAEPLMRRAIAILERTSGAGHLELATLLSNLAGLLQETNRAAEAEPLARRALAMIEGHRGSDHPSVAAQLGGLALLMKTTNRLAQAEPLYRRALAIDESALGSDHPDVARDLNNLAQLLQETNRWTEAEPMMRRALTIIEASFGPIHPMLATQLNNLGLLLRATNRMAEAEPLYRRALSIDEASLGQEHPHVARDLNNLAVMLLAMERPAEAERFARRALAIDEKCLGSDHPDVARDWNNLGQICQATGRLAEAEPHIRRALAVFEKGLGPEHPKVAAQLSNLATLLHATGRAADAEPLMRRALAIDERRLGVVSQAAATDLYNLAQLLVVLQRFAEAEPLFHRALGIDEERLGEEHPDVARDLYGIVQLRLIAGRLDGV
ncbi:MAG: tetratricopeptide repeat protein, partial [Candidatus Eisenbacteria bacterium]|nr:tetratricopeptide repeat protein [Candidatus Eisenbacteria bacterium]